MKLSKDELKAKIDEKIADEDLKIELLEDIEDSIEVDDEEKVSKADYDSVVAERDEIKEKYKARFLSKDEEKVEVEEKEENEGLSEKEEVDVKEIFKEED